MTETPRRILLTGFSFTGKSLVAPLVARALGWRALDLDDLIEAAAGKPVAQIFADEGESGFRRRESEALAQVCRERDVVVATGGGIVLADANRRLMGERGVVVCLEARPETVLRRMRQAGVEGSERPLLKSANPLARIRHLKALRQTLYALADHTVHTDTLSPEAVADEIVRAWERLSGASLLPDRFVLPAGEVSEPSQPEIAAWVATETARYPVYAAWGSLPDLGKRMKEAGLGGRAHVVSDSNVWALHGAALETALREAKLKCDSCVVPAGEASKGLDTASMLYDWLAARRAERGDAIVAFGGGMVGDLAGFVAATYLRGVPLVQAPTSLLAMVDASIGGKVAVNHREAKNIIGAFHQPRLVFADVSLLTTLPRRELVSGWAEVIKHALIMDAALLEALERQGERLLALEPEATAHVVRRSMALKAQVVSEDERETTGRRTILNYGHTVGHALEAASEYEALLHGEAVSVGMVAAAEIGRRLGVTPPALAERQRALLERFGLPVRASGLRAERVVRAMELDKKVERESVRWVLLADVGHPVLRSDVPASLVAEALDAVLG
ncbi:MAG: 3-dehydroquinate synthase [Dehalococcoidia bacterium]|nr:3-dehydroquinate synthase [Dehalococcoidia bacterium]